MPPTITDELFIGRTPHSNNTTPRSLLGERAMIAVVGFE